jgi:nicotinamidase/pyrazinamidase
MRSGLFGTLVATQDWHPQNHVSFAGRHEGRRPLDTIDLYGHEQTLWPDHCVQQTAGARLHPALPWERVDAFVRKGQDPAVDSYSGFRNNWGPHHTRPRTGLAGYLRDRGVEEVFICGLARDVCVCWTAQDAAEERFSTTVLWDLSRPVDPANDRRVRDDFGQRRIRIADSGQLPR